MRGALPWVTAVAGIVLVVAGLVVLVLADRAPVGDFGWSTYAPLEPGEPAPYASTLTISFDDGWTVLTTGRHLLAAALVVAGLLVLSALGGWLLGRTSRRA